MKAAIFQGIGQVEVVEVPEPTPGPGEVLIQVQVCGICGSDVDAFRTGTYEPGVIIGHELAGDIVAVGKGVWGWSVGDRVTVNGVWPCGRCRFCQHGRHSLCEDMQMTGITVPGAFAEFMVAPAGFLYRLPANVTYRQAALVDPMATALHGVRDSVLRPGDRVMVLGAGPIGLLTLACALAAGAESVAVTELGATRAEVARALGAAHVWNPVRDNLFVRVDEWSGGRGPDVVFVCAGVPAAMEDAVTLVRKGGQIFVLGICEEPVAGDFMTVVLNELDIRGGYCGYEEYPMCLELISQGRIDAERIVSHVIPLDDIVTRGFEALTRPDTDAVKVLVTPR
jgi:2-desacetyl-2-hydroxyethyl bacteriochlorophyllide A dehydrogenase